MKSLWESSYFLASLWIENNHPVFVSSALFGMIIKITISFNINCVIVKKLSEISRLFVLVSFFDLVYVEKIVSQLEKSAYTR